MFKIERIKVDNAEQYKKKYRTDDAAYAAAKHLVLSQGRFRKIGSGCFGVVYGNKNSPIVYKMGYVEENTPYLSYVTELSKIKKPNPFLPVIHGCRIYNHGSNSHFVVAMERLHEGEGIEFRCAVDLISSMVEYDEIVTANEFDKKWKICQNDLTTAQKIVKRAYNRASREDSAGYDLHYGNCMVRGNDQLVITDPLS